MKELHIPFGLDRTTREEVEPEDAARGRACNCICPGCEAPLLSRHPQDESKRIHFAHDSRHPDAKPVDECPLSPYVALGMMLRKISDSLSGMKIKLNAYSKWVDFKCCPNQSSYFKIVPDQILTIDFSEASPSIGGVTYDLCLSIQGTLYFVDLSYPGKPQKDLPASIPASVTGVICIDGTEFIEMMTKGEFHQRRYSDAVRHFLLEYSIKRWSFHSYEIPKIRNAQSDHRCLPKPSRPLNSYSNSSTGYSGRSPNQSPATFHNRPDSQVYDAQQRQRQKQEAAEAYRSASTGGDRPLRSFDVGPLSYSATLQHPLSKLTFECLFCIVEFQVDSGTLPMCPSCNRHLGARPINSR